MALSAVFSDVLWLAGGLGQFTAGSLLVRRKLVRQFQAFFSYLVFHVAEQILAIFLYRHFGRASWPYLYEYWAAQAIGIALRFGVIYEIFLHVFQPYEGLRQAGRVGFRWAAIVL